jgi:hypothetical protein
MIRLTFAALDKDRPGMQSRCFASINRLQRIPPGYSRFGEAEEVTDTGLALAAKAPNR